jgi:DivIVA domain-containing protein
MHGRTRAVLVIGLCTAVAVIVALAPPTPQWARHAFSLAVYLAVVASVSALLLYRGWRTGVRFGGDGLTIRYFFGTRRLGWHEVSRFADGCTGGLGEGAGQVWALDVVLHDGRVVTVKATARDTRSAASKVLTEVLQAAECYGIQAPLTGVVSKRRSRTSVEEHPSEPAPSTEAGGIILSDWAASREFSTTRLRPGYDIEEVDAFLEAIRQTFLGTREPPLTTEEIRIKRFATTRLRPGYDEEEVDAFLNAVELRLAASTRPGRHGGLLVPARCPECGMETTDPTRSCARCGAPIAGQNSVAADRAAGESADSVAPAGPGHQSPAKNAVPSASWWAIGGGVAVFLGSLLPWISVYVYDGNLLDAPDDPNLFKTVAVGNSISGGARAAAAVFGLILMGLATAIHFTSARGVVARPRAYVYGIPLAALTVLGMVGCGIFAVAGYIGFREADGPGIVGYGIFTLQERHPILAEDGTAGSAHVSFTPNVGLIMILLGCMVAVIGAIRSL